MLSNLKSFLILVGGAILSLLFLYKKGRSDGMEEIKNGLKDEYIKQLENNKKLEEHIESLSDEELDKLC